MAVSGQLSMLDWEGHRLPPRPTEQARQAARVSSGIDLAVLAWCKRHVGEDFHLETFTAGVRAEAACAPDSPRRRMHALHDEGHIDILCVDRSRSLWRVVRA